MSNLKVHQVNIVSEVNELEKINNYNSASKITNYKRSNFPLLRSHSQLEAKQSKPDLVIHKAIKSYILPTNKLAKKVNFSDVQNDTIENETSVENENQEQNDIIKIINEPTLDELNIGHVEVKKVRVKKKRCPAQG